jgi:hypothetical protein
MSLPMPAEFPGQACPASLGLTPEEVAQAHGWAAEQSLRSGQAYRAEGRLSEEGALLVGLLTPSARQDSFIRPGDCNYQVMRTPSGVHLYHPVTGGPLASFADLAAALAELATIEEVLALMGGLEAAPPEPVRAAA